MRALFSLKLWLILMNRLVEAFFPVVCILLIFSWFSDKGENKAAFRKDSHFKLLIIVVLSDFFIRALLFFSGVPFSHRYLLVLTVMAIMMAAPGVPKLTELLQKLTGRYFAVTPRFSIFVFSLLSIACVGKALSPRLDKKWIREIPVVIKNLCPEGRKPVLIMDFDDRRIPYYAKADYLKFGTKPDKIFYYTENGILQKCPEPDGIIAKPGEKKWCGLFVALNVPPAGLANFADDIRKLGAERVFVLMYRKDSEFRELFSAKGLIFPLKLIQEFHDDKGRPLSLYQGHN